MKITRHKIFRFCFFLMIPFSSYAQTYSNDTLNYDSLRRLLPVQKEDTNKVKTLTALGWKYRGKSNYPEAIKNFVAASKIAGKINDKSGSAKSIFAIAVTQREQGNYAEATRYVYMSLKFYEQLNDKKGMADCLRFIGDISKLQENYPEALNNYYKALKLSKELLDKTNIAWAFQVIGDVHLDQGNDAEALKNYLLALKIREELSDKVAIGQSNVVIGRIYSTLHNYSEALKRDSVALKIFQELGEQGPNWGIPMCFEYIGATYAANGDFEDLNGNKGSAQKKYSQALKNCLNSNIIYRRIGPKRLIASSEAGLGNLYIKLKKFPQAEDHLQKALRLSIETGMKPQIRDIYQNLSSLENMQGKYKLAYEHYKLYTLYSDSLYNEEAAKKSLQAQMQYEFDKKELISQAKQEKKDAETKRIKNLQYFVIGGLCVVVLGILLIALIQWRNNLQKRKANELLQNQKEKVESTLSELKTTQSQLIQSEKMASLGELTAGIAHEIQNPLNFVNNFSDVNKELIEELEKEAITGNIVAVKALASDLRDNEQKINHHGKRADAIVKGMLQHSRTNTGQKELTDINALADEYLRLSYHGCRARDKFFSTSFETHFDETLEKIAVVPQDIGRVFLNIFNNAFYSVSEQKNVSAKSYEPRVMVATKKEDNKNVINISDNGTGIPQKVKDKIFQPFFTTKPTGQGTGLGLSLSYDIIKAHGGDITLETTQGEGTTFVIRLPLK